MVKRCRVSKWGNENTLKFIVVKAVQHCEYTKNLYSYTLNG